MTGQDWVVIINQLIGKTRDGRVTWAFDDANRRCEARVGDAFTVVFEYLPYQVGQALRPTPNSLALTVIGADGRKLARLDEAECARLEGQADEIALRQLFEVLIARPREDALNSFREALEGL